MQLKTSELTTLHIKVGAYLASIATNATTVDVVADQSGHQSSVGYPNALILLQIGELYHLSAHTSLQLIQLCHLQTRYEIILNSL